MHGCVRSFDCSSGRGDGPGTRQGITWLGQEAQRPSNNESGRLGAGVKKASERNCTTWLCTFEVRQGGEDRQQGQGTSTKNAFANKEIKKAPAMSNWFPPGDQTGAASSGAGHRPQLRKEPSPLPSMQLQSEGSWQWPNTESSLGSWSATSPEMFPPTMSSLGDVQTGSSLARGCWDVGQNTFPDLPVPDGEEADGPLTSGEVRSSLIPPE